MISNQNPDISLVVPVRNAATYLRECMDSCLCQAEVGIEVVAIDDASSDDSLGILREYERKDPRVRVIPFAENKGAHLARRAGVEAASGDYVFCLDSDDRISSPQVCRKLIDRARATRADLLLFGAHGFTETERPDARLAEHVSRFNAKAVTSDVDEISVLEYEEALFAKDSMIWIPAGKLFARARLLAAIHALPDGYCWPVEDVLMLASFLVDQPRIAATSMIGYDYRIGAGISYRKVLSQAGRLNLLRTAQFFSSCFSKGARLFGYRYASHLLESVWRPTVQRALAGCGQEESFGLLAESAVWFHSSEWRHRLFEVAFDLESEAGRMGLQQSIDSLRKSKKRWRAVALVALVLLVGAITTAICVCVSA